jgi:hypothetical protein
MRTLFGLLLVLCLPALAQEEQAAARPGESNLREQMREMSLAVYRRPDVAALCAKTPDGELTIMLDGPGAEFTLSCRVRRQWIALMVEFYRLPAMEEACKKAPTASVTVRVFGQDTLVSCPQRAQDLKLWGDAK